MESGWSLLTDSRESGLKNKSPTTQLEVKAVLNRIQHFVGFVYQSIRLQGSGGSLRVEIRIEPHRGIRGKCSTCRRPCPGYDQLQERRWLFVPMWGIVCHFFYLWVAENPSQRKKQPSERMRSCRSSTRFPPSIAIGHRNNSR